MAISRTSEMDGGESERTVTSLITGLLGDAQRLLGQEVELVKSEVRGEAQLLLRSGVLLLVSGCFILGFVVLLSLMLVSVIHEMAPGVSEWQGFGLVALTNAALAGLSIWAAKCSIAHDVSRPRKFLGTASKEIDRV